MQAGKKTGLVISVAWLVSVCLPPRSPVPGGSQTVKRTGAKETIRLVRAPAAIRIEIPTAAVSRGGTARAGRAQSTRSRWRSASSSTQLTAAGGISIYISRVEPLAERQRLRVALGGERKRADAAAAEAAGESSRLQPQPLCVERHAAAAVRAHVEKRCSFRCKRSVKGPLECRQRSGSGRASSRG